MITDARKDRLIIIISAAIALCLFSFNGIIRADEQEGKIISRELKKVQGEVGSLNARYIGIDYKEDEESGVAYEIVLAIDKDTKLAHKKSLAGIGIGDTVGVTYEEITEAKDEGRKRTRRVAKMIRFVRPADEETRHKYGIFTEKEKREMMQARQEMQATQKKE